MKKLLLTITLVALATTVWADGKGSKPSCAGFVSNGFWDNWELSGAAGVQTAISNGKNYGDFGNRLGFEGNLSVAKWIHPVAGMRFQFQGGYFNNYDPKYGKMEWPYLFMHIDFMANLSNWIGGYRDDRAYYAVPFIGAGYMATNFTDKSQRNTHIGMSQNFAFSLGLLNKFRLSPSVDFNIELKCMIVPSHISPVTFDGGYLFGLSATAGFTYRFNKRGWERGVAGYTTEDIRAFQDAVAQGQNALADANAANARLNGDMNAVRAEAAAAKSAAADAEKNAAVQIAEAQCKMQSAGSVSWAILYGLDEWTLSPREKTRLDIVVERMKSGSKDKVYTIEGHADSQTGSAEVNQRISEKRAKNVYNYLVSRGVNPEQLKYEGLGDGKNPYSFPKANRLVVIK